MTSSVPAWFQVLAAIGASFGIVGAMGVVIALVVLNRDRGRYKQDRKDRDEDRQDRKEDRADRLGELSTQALERSDRQAAQARLVTCTLGVEAGRGWCCVVTNHSASIILNLHVHEPINVLETGWRLVATVDPRVEELTHIITPGDSVSYYWRRLDQAGAPTPPPTPVDKFRATTAPIEFTDAAGLRWTRQGLDQPQRQHDVTDT